MKLNINQRGFTLIELLIVIAIIAILAIAVLAAINPIEQLGRSRDTSKRSDAGQIIGAFDRYYAGRQMFPWNDADVITAHTGTDTDPDGAYPDGVSCTGADFCDITSMTDNSVITALEEFGEVKNSFTTRVLDGSDNNHLLVYKEANDDTVYVCYEPQSDQFRVSALEYCIANQPNLPTAIRNIVCPGGIPANALPATYTTHLICLP